MNWLRYFWLWLRTSDWSWLDAAPGCAVGFIYLCVFVVVAWWSAFEGIEAAGYVAVAMVAGSYLVRIVLLLDRWLRQRRGWSD